jgi:hypothetical protein
VQRLYRVFFIWLSAKPSLPSAEADSGSVTIAAGTRNGEHNVSEGAARYRPIGVARDRAGAGPPGFLGTACRPGRKDVEGQGRMENMRLGGESSRGGDWAGGRQCWSSSRRWFAQEGGGRRCRSGCRRWFMREGSWRGAWERGGNGSPGGRRAVSSRLHCPLKCLNST